MKPPSAGWPTWRTRSASALEIDARRRRGAGRKSSLERRCPTRPMSRRDSRGCGSERERLGAVNLRAEEELPRSRRSTTTLTPSATIWSRRSSGCARASSNLNREGRERLLAAFEIVNEHFQQPVHAACSTAARRSCSSIEIEDPLEAGLDILARPPGKKPQTLSLLSAASRR